MTQRQLPGGQQPQAKQVRGILDAVPCPSCGRPNDLRVLAEQQLLDTGHKIYCDHCGYSMEVCRIMQMTVINVRFDPTSPRRTPRHAQPGRQLPAGQQQQQRRTAQLPRKSGGVIQKLFGPPPGPKRR